MKRLFFFIGLVCFSLTVSFAQNKKADQEAVAKAKFEKAIAAIEAKDFVIIVDTWESPRGTIETNTDNSNFLSYEKELVFMQGSIFFGLTDATHQMNVSDYNQVVDKKDNIKIEMQVRGSLIAAKIEIFLRSGSNYAYVISYPTKGRSIRFTGEIVPVAESKYIKRAGIVY